MKLARVSILQIFVRNGGVRNAFRAATYLASWGAVYESLGRVPTVDEYSDFWKQSRTTTWRESRSFEACAAGSSVERVWLSLPVEVRRSSDADARVADVASARWAL
jgi:hypothetical protein